MNVSNRWPLQLLFAVTLAGCGGAGFDESKPPVPPTAAHLSRIVAKTRQPGYWLGPRFRGIQIGSATVNRRGVSLTYGPWTCSSGCSDSGGIFTQRRDVRLQRSDLGDGAEPKDCWTRIGEAVAVLVGCEPDGYPQELEIYSGTRAITVTSLYTRDGRGEIPAGTVVRRLRPLNANAPWPLARPKRLSCRELQQVADPYRRQMPAALAPNARC